MIGIDAGGQFNDDIIMTSKHISEMKKEKYTLIDEKWSNSVLPNIFGITFDGLLKFMTITCTVSM